LKVAFNHIEPFKVPEATKLKLFIADIFKKEKKALQTINYIFCSDEYLLKINRSFLKHDDFTDIITFDLSDSGSTIGEIYISTDRIKDNATTFATSFKKELYRVIIHGALHLIGYKDKTKSESEIMRSKEDHYLLLFDKK
jgi:rRNA maturation RNase YbeY